MLEGIDSLDKIETRLRTSLSSVELIAELSLSEDDVSKLRRILRNVFDSSRFSTAAIRKLDNQYSHITACFLVWQGITNYRAGDFWNGVQELTGPLLGNERSEIGQIFEKVLRQHNNLVKFNDLAVGHRYVTPILAHGGIPDYCLDDFFKNVLSPVVTGKIEFFGDADELIKDWLMQPSLVAFTDKPVRRFLLAGGAPARDFLQRCLDMAAVQHVDPSVDFGLPQRVVERFTKWNARQPRDGWPTSQGQVGRVAPPTLCLEPGLGILSLNFPQQRVKLALGAEASLSIAIHGIKQSPIIRRLRTRKRNNLCETEPIEHEIDRRPIQDTLTVELLAGQLRLRSWQFRCFSREKPFMIFSERTRAAESSAQIREARCWLAFPRTYELTGGLMEEMGCALWQDFHVHLLSLESSDDLRLHNSENDISIPILQISRNSPEVEMRVARWPHVSSGDFEVSSLVPDLVVPSEKGSAQLLTIQSIDREGSTRSVQVTSDFPSSRLSLADKKLLGPSAFGRYALRLRGRLGEDQGIRICIIPGLQVQLRAEDLIPSGHEDAPIDLQIRVENHVDIEALSPAELLGTTNVSKEIKEFTVRTPRNALGAGLLARSSSAESATVPLFINVPVVRWAITGLYDLGIPRFSHEPLTLSLSDLDQSNDPRLLIRCDLGEEVNVFAETNSDHRQAIMLRNGAGVIRLAEFFDTWRSLGRDAILRLGINGTNFRREADIVRIQNHWAVKNVNVREEANETTRYLLVEWHDQGRANDRSLLIWNVSQPWAPPIEEPIPDGESAVIVERPAKEIPRSAYRLQFTIDDPWNGLPRPALPPAASLQNVVEQELGSTSLPSHFSEFQSWLYELARARARGQSVSQIVRRPTVPPPAGQSDYEALACCLAFWLPAKKLECKINSDVWQQICGTTETGAAFIGLLHGLAKVYQRERTVELAEIIRRLLIGLDFFHLNLTTLKTTALDNQSRDLLWEIWTPLGLIFELMHFETNDTTRFAQHCIRSFGREPVTTILGLDEATDIPGCDNDPEYCLVCRLVRPRCSSSRSIQYPSDIYGTSEGLQHSLARSADQIHELQDALGLVPVGLFHRDQYAALVLRWLTDSNISQRWERTAQSRRIGELRNYEEAVNVSKLRQKIPWISGICDAALRRSVKLDLENIPLLSACVALLQRVEARGIDSGLRLDELRRSAIRAYRAAPDLYARDLCLFELSVGIASKTAEVEHGA